MYQRLLSRQQRAIQVSSKTPNNMQPTQRARERGSPAKPARHSRRPSLSASRLNNHFFVDDTVLDENDKEEDYTWQPHEVRFVHWYYLTTHLTDDAIAVAFNATFRSNGGGVPEMEAQNVEVIIQTIRDRMESMNDEAWQGGLGRWPRPVEVGWIPCDHGMGCATVAQDSQGRVPSVMRVSELRTRSGREIADMATTLWEGDWEELLLCPRNHPKPATTTPTYSPPTVGAFQRTPRPGDRKRKPVEVITISDSSDSTVTDRLKPSNTSTSARPPSGPGLSFAPGANGPNNSAPSVLQTRVLRSSPRKLSTNAPQTQRSTSVRRWGATFPLSSSNKENHGPASNLRSASRSKPVEIAEKESDADQDEPMLRAAARSSSSNMSSARSFHDTTTARSSGDSSYRSALTRGSSEHAVSPLSGPEPEPERAVANALSTDTRSIVPLWFFLQQVIRGICLWIALDAFFDSYEDNIDNIPHHLRERRWWPALHFVCVTLIARDFMSFAFNQAREDD